VEEVDVEGVNIISWLLEYITLQKGITKVTKDLDSENFMISTPLLPEQVEFEGPPLVHVPVLKMEDWELVDHERFLHLATSKV